MERKQFYFKKTKPLMIMTGVLGLIYFFTCYVEVHYHLRTQSWGIGFPNVLICTFWKALPAAFFLFPAFFAAKRHFRWITVGAGLAFIAYLPMCLLCAVSYFKNVHGETWLFLLLIVLLVSMLPPLSFFLYGMSVLKSKALAICIMGVSIAAILIALLIQYPFYFLIEWPGEEFLYVSNIIGDAILPYLYMIFCLSAQERTQP